MLYYTISIFLSAFLLFQIQPLIGKYILPWFGGTPAVWSTLMLFFQAFLLAGYAYAYGLITRVSARRQGIVHLIMCSVSLILLAVTALLWQSPITPGANWRPSGDGMPIWDIFRILAVSVGLPYFLLSTNSPLIQAWFNGRYPGRSPYWLYALSNIGSLLALVTYPVLVEPALTVRAQGWLWSAGYAAFAVLLGIGAFQRIRALPAAAQSAKQATAPQNESASKPKAWLLFLWVALAATASVMLLAVTSQITQEVAVIPFLWVLPLTIYLLSFILTFSSERWYGRGFYGIGLAVASTLLIWVLSRGLYLNILVQLAGYLGLLFVCCMFCHGELVRLKPVPRYLTTFYLMVSLGGVVGGIFVNLVAPYIFSGFWELQLGVVLCWVLLLVVFLANPPTWSLPRRAAAIAMIVVGGIVVADFLWIYIQVLTTNTIAGSRNFYGVMRVRLLDAEPEMQAYQLTHGATSHGFQYLDDTRRRLPTAYFTETSGIGLAFLNHPKHAQGMQVGVLGLGIGTLAAYGQENDVIRFYEINPDVIYLAEGQGGYFSYLSDCSCQVFTVLGDARISLERELATGQATSFDLLVLDTFNSDSIPSHLLTSQAFDIYLQRLQPDGVLALHVTNRHLDLLPVVRQLAEAHQLSGIVVENDGDNQRHYGSTWVLLSRDASIFQQPAITSRGYPIENVPAQVRLWTDDYNNLFQILK